MLPWAFIIFIIAVSAFLLLQKYKRWRTTPLRIKKRVWYSGGLKMAVNICNISKNIVEIDAPQVEFRMPRMKKRKFKIVSPGEETIFPLGLSPQTSYNFTVEFIALYEKHEILRKYKKLIIHVNDINKKSIVKQRVKLIQPRIK
jgi:hypothetical protein